MKKIITFIALTFISVFSATASINLKASQAEYFEEIKNGKFSAASYSVFPVKLQWNADGNSSYKILCSKGDAKNFQVIKELSSSDVAASINAGNQTFFHDEKSFTPGIKYFYKIQKLDANKNVTEESNVAEGWGALNHEQFFLYADATIKSSHKRLKLMNKKSNLEKLGTETSNGILQGSITYKAAAQGFSGLVTMDYKSYSDFEPLKVDGTLTTKANLKSDGTMGGTLTYSGMYSGTIDYSKIEIKNGMAGGGTYAVTPAGYTKKEISYEWSLKGDN